MLGQFYKVVEDFSLIAQRLQELHWLRVLWLGVLVILVAVAMGALLGVGTRLLYRKVLA